MNFLQFEVSNTIIKIIYTYIASYYVLSKIAFVNICIRLVLNAVICWSHNEL